jgi:hypothetical protein
MTEWREMNWDWSDSVLLGNTGDLTVRALDVIPGTLTPGTDDNPLIGIEFRASEEVFITAMTFERLGTADDQDTTALHLYEDNGDRIFNVFDRDQELGDGNFASGFLDLSFPTPVIIQPDDITVVFLAADISINAVSGHTIGVYIDQAAIGSTARDVLGDFPLASAVADISSMGGRANNATIDFDDDVIDDAWDSIGPLADGSIWDDWRGERRTIPGGRNIRNGKASDNGTWLNFFVRMRGNLNADIHVYIDTNNNGVADYDLVYDNTNGTVLLYAWNGTAWNSVTLDSTDRSDQSGNRLELGIEFWQLGLTNNTAQTIRYRVRSEPNIVPGGSAYDTAPSIFGIPLWRSYTTIPEFQDLIIPVMGSIILFSILRRRKFNKSKKQKEATK